MAETPPRVPPQSGREDRKQSAGDAPILGAATTKKVKLDDTAFGARFNGPLVHESVRAELNARRRGTASTKTRGQVRGGGAKPWRQKGTGRARAGSTRSPIWTGGGITFGPQPRHYTFKVNRKERRAALRSALSVHAERATIAILDPEPFGSPSTKQAHELIEDWAGGGSVLVVLADDQIDVALSFRNLRRVSVLPADAVGVADLVGAASLLVTQDALDDLTRRAKGEKAAAGEAADDDAAAEEEDAE
jgi:large subunit ribosomal protein L4